MPDEAISSETDNFPIKFTIMNVSLIGINVVIFIYHQLLSPYPIQFEFREYGVVPAYVVDGLNLYSLFTSMFLHGSLGHLLGTMAVLSISGGSIEKLMGPIRYLGFYLLCGVGAAISHVLFYTNSKVVLIGSGGAVAGVLGACLVCYLRTRVTLLLVLLPLRLPVALVIGIWLLSDIIGFVTTSIGHRESDSAWLVNISGFVIGLILVRFFKPKKHETSMAAGTSA